MHWSAPKRPVDHVEEALISAILEGDFPPGSALPAERELAVQLGVTRPTLREVLRRLERDGWITIQQGKSTLVNAFWWEGGLNVISGIVRYSRTLPDDFVSNLLQVRLDLAPSYTRLAVIHDAPGVAVLLAEADSLPEAPPAFAAYDWRLQHGLTIASRNPVYAMILNGFAGFYESLACHYFATAEARSVSRAYYAALLEAARAGDAPRAEMVTREVMAHSITLWAQAQHALIAQSPGEGWQRKEEQP